MGSARSLPTVNAVRFFGFFSFFWFFRFRFSGFS